MELNTGSRLHGFTVTRVRPIPGKDAGLVEMLYEKTGTELVWVRSGETNKLFSIAFKTVPENSTGVFHILEHSVLCGSEKYPVKEPFVELLKSSMNTFLNAMTFPDKTVYPVSSRNTQDYLNLTSVYLDAVFAPRILTEPNIFYQEGWHYETEEDKLTYNGVVFNEMKGATSGVDNVVSESMQQLLFPDTCYGYNSGGDPEVIPELTYEQFLDAYRRNYHPTNARIYLDGDIPLEETLALIESYLCRYEPGSRQELTAQTPRAGERTVCYESAPEEDLSSKAQLTLGKLMGSWEDKTGLLAAHVLCDVLAGSNDAPIKRAILSAGLGQDVSMQVNDGVYQPWLTLRIHNMKDEDAAAIRALLADTARNLVENGIPREELTASINRLAFQMKDMHEPQGLIRCLSALDSWLYGGDPMLFLSYDDAIARLREMAKTDGFEKLLQSLLLDETGLCVLHTVPSLTLGEETRAREAARLEEARKAMTAEEQAAVAGAAEALRLWQQKPDAPEALATLPTLSLDQVSDKPAELATVTETVNGVTLLRHKTGTNGIIHLSAYFPLSDFSLEELTGAPFAAALLGQLPTENYDAVALQNQIKTHLGSLSIATDVFGKAGQTRECTPCLTVQCSVLKENLAKAQELVVEVLTRTDFDQPARIREILLQEEMGAQQSAMMGGHRFAATCAQAHYSAVAAVSEAFSGYTNLSWLHSFSRSFDDRIAGFTAFCRKLTAAAVCTARMTLSLTEEFETDVSGLIAALPVGTPAAPAHYETDLPKRLGIRIPAQVSYACAASHLAACGASYNGTLKLLTNILSLSCLWNAVRVQGGAYGAGIQAGRSGGMFCWSYRDPSPARSLGVYRSLADFIGEFARSGEVLDKFIISTVASTEPLVSPKVAGALADGQWFQGLSYEDAVAERRQLLKATMDDLTAWCPALEALAKGAVCVVGHSDALGDCAEEGMTVCDI